MPRSLSLSAGLAVLGILLAACGSTTNLDETLEPSVPEQCGNGADDDGDRKADCADPDCFSASACSVTPTPENCTSAGDEDQDGLADCDDPDCTGTRGCGVAPTTPDVTPEICTNGIDDDADGEKDCADSSCATDPACAQTVTETSAAACQNGKDDDGDGLTDCFDNGCVNAPNCVAAENCTNGLDDDGDRAIDCADANCASNTACRNLVDGAACAADNQCAGGKCYTEASSGFPSGSCGNAVSCNPTAQTGCNGGLCVEVGAFDVCRARCNGRGTGPSGKCRPGYACLDVDQDPGTGSSVCVALCNKDTDCAGSGANYGCNAWSRYCEVKDRGLRKYGAPCTASSQCEGAICDTSVPGGYCFGWCDGTSLACGPGGACAYDSSSGDNIGWCYQKCTATSECRGTPYTCQSDSGLQACWCRPRGSLCSTNSECCSGSCNSFFGDCD